MTQYRFQFLLFTLFVMLLTMPLITRLGALSRYGTAFLFSMLLLAAVTAVSERRVTGKIAVGLCIISFILEMLGLWFESGTLMITQNLASTFFLAFVVVVILNKMLRTSHVTANTICAALSVYLLLAVIWSYIYTMIELIHPDSFIFNTQILGNQASMLSNEGRSVVPLYYSLVTLTTLGYGDIVPVSPMACMLAVVEAVVGQFYLTVLVAWLVGLYVSDSLKRKMSN